MSTPNFPKLLRGDENCCTYNVMTDEAKGDRMHFRVHPVLKEDVRIVARLRGLTPSSLIHSLLVMTVNEEKKRNPEAFQAASNGSNPPQRTLTKVRVIEGADQLAIERRAKKSRRG